MTYTETWKGIAGFHDNNRQWVFPFIASKIQIRKGSLIFIFILLSPAHFIHALFPYSVPRRAAPVTKRAWRRDDDEYPREAGEAQRVHEIFKRRDRVPCDSFAVTWMTWIHTFHMRYP